ncbi:MAG TPA: heat-inducible transcriptional repressor HrcA, partial [Acidobacteriaceae bacterium]|nr:heat-inducible transcriptional repressor HrcA [Acidobacteriaceae bacterium]
LDFMPASSYSRSMEVNGSSNSASNPRGPAVDAPIGPRKELVLTAIVENYIANGEPVASQSVARQHNREGMSAATVRNVMAELSEAGFLEQPHTSAGRIPTAQAFRYYVEQLLRRKSSARQVLPQPTQEQIEESFTGVANATDFFARTSHILALLSGGVGVGLGVTAATADWELLEHVHFTRLGVARVLTVLVTTAGVVRDRLLTLEHDLTPGELETAANYLNQNFHGWALERIRQELTRRMDRERNEYNQVLCSLELWAKGAMDPMADRNSQEKSIFMDGVANLMVNEADRRHLREIFLALEEKQRIIDLLNAYVDSKQPSVRVVVGLEEAIPEMRDLVLIAAPARRGAEHLGTVAVIGPTRIQYASAIGTVTYIADLFGRWAAQP